MRGAAKVALILLTAAAILMVALATSPPSAGDATPSPSPIPSLTPSPSPSPSPTYERASDGLVAWALKWRRLARRSLERLDRARACYGLERVHLKPTLPRRSADRLIWLAAGKVWRWRVGDYRRRADVWRYRMCHPGGSGVERWRPLVRWHWPSWLVEPALRVMRKESNGRPRAVNRISGAGGLFQLYPPPEGWANPDTNVWYAYHRKYLPAGGWGPWAVM